MSESVLRMEGERQAHLSMTRKQASRRKFFRRQLRRLQRRKAVIDIAFGLEDHWKGEVGMVPQVDMKWIPGHGAWAWDQWMNRRA
jgi:hypothetical protein